jgi:hypothetical protein
MKAFGAFNKAFQVGDGMYFGYLWISLDEDDDVRFDLEITEKVYAQKLSDELAKFKEQLKEKLKSAKPLTATISERVEPDDIPF